MSSKFVQTHDDKGLGIFAKPLATEKMLKKLQKILKAIKDEKRKHCTVGIKFVTKAIDRDHDKGIVIITGDVKQIDMIAHLPILCEENDIPYVWIAKRNQLYTLETGFTFKMAPAVLMLKRDNLEQKMQDKFDEVVKKIKKEKPSFD
eukprot:CAMPEP_0197043836 /NCGR_PEP_ID=MMETSP1384-20130603/20028_1 /TAXON_ID=29189 /ORGANISM="Ammonia sp." /LENGTH=146 /DNA_ID=CAMNT_0042475201 /DNA_START=28 /DNA_END=468 /DNA_ORIENTATION=-